VRAGSRAKKKKKEKREKKRKAHMAAKTATSTSKRRAVRRNTRNARARDLGGDAASPTIASLASVPHRADMLEQVVNSLYGQVDRINVFLNGYSSVPTFLLRPQIHVGRSQEHGDRGDAGKFHWAGELGDCYHLTCDDDLVYPGDYAATMKRKIERYERNAVVGLHGVVLVARPRRSYYRERRVYRCTRSVGRDTVVNILGTGVCAYHTSTLRVDRSMFRKANMADIWLGIAAMRQSVPMIVIRHGANWLKELPDPRPERSVFARYRGRDSEQFQVVRSVAPWPRPRPFRGAVAGCLQ